MCIFIQIFDNQDKIMTKIFIFTEVELELESTEACCEDDYVITESLFQILP